ncbi:MFS transporter [Cupriavidus lacunae]|uniref:MFS transporter n=1 Tax=Cupriavidus lacunae TaxID=2666307 RepID=A0A370NLU5_9BURK|nr:MFS transporter [Cupriavidus lacunae]RDK06575.1 MFS transporter [Cupriavidus lacunae]
MSSHDKVAGGTGHRAGAASGPRLDRLPIGTFHYRLLWLIAGGLFFDAFDVYLLAGVTGALVKEGFATLNQAAHIVSATYAGLVVGALLAGYVGDRFGRKVCYQINLAVVSVGTLCTALASSPESMVVLRFVTAIGLGAEAVISYATLSEFIPPARRGRWLGLLAFIANLAVFASALCGYLLLPQAGGWRWMFAIAGAGALVMWVLRWRLVESPRWLESKGRFDKADAVLRKIEALCTPAGGLPPVRVEQQPARQADAGLSELFSGAARRRTLLGMFLNIVQYVAIYGLLVWLPGLYVKQGLALSTSLEYSLFMSAGGPAGALLAALLSDHIGRRRGIVGFSLLAALLGWVYSMQTSPVAIAGLGFLLFTAVYVLATYVFAGYVAELFPTAVRSRGTGLCSGIGRAVSIGLPYVVVWLFGVGGITAVAVAVSVLLLLQAGVVWLWGPETNSVALEALEAQSDEISAGRRTLAPGTRVAKH